MNIILIESSLRFLNASAGKEDLCRSFSGISSYDGETRNSKSGDYGKYSTLNLQDLPQAGRYNRYRSK